MSDSLKHRAVSRHFPYWLATPTGGSMDAQYCSSLVRTLAYLREHDHHLPKYAMQAGPEIPNLHSMLDTIMRQTTVEQGIFWLGADHSWTVEDYLRIIDEASGNAHSVIGALYQASDGSRLVGEPLQDVVVPGPLQPARFLGWGFIYTPFSAFKAMTPPFWSWDYLHDPAAGGGQIVSPDVYFCKKARQAGVHVYLHRHILDVGHGLRQPHKTSREWMQERGQL